LTKILVVRLGAMGDILHTIPAVERIRHSLPQAEITWVLEPRWMPLLSGTGLANHLLPLDRRDALSVWIAARWLRRWKPDLALDFQGLWKSSLTALVSGATNRRGFAPEFLRERESAVLYTETVAPTADHVVLQNLELTGLPPIPPVHTAPIGFPEGKLPEEPFVLAAPFAGWKSKQWPVERYAEIGQRLWQERGMRLVLNVMPSAQLPESEYLIRHESGMEGLIDATRRATAVIGLDSGPLHLAALMNKPGIALFGPTDPARNGPHGGSIRVLRAPAAVTSYKRDNEVSESMLRLDVERVWQSLTEVLP
jgi:heptosyltransferase-1